MTSKKELLGHIEGLRDHMGNAYKRIAELEVKDASKRVRQLEEILIKSGILVEVLIPAPAQIDLVVSKSREVYDRFTGGTRVVYEPPQMYAVDKKLIAKKGGKGASK